MTTFDEIIPPDFKPAFKSRHTKVAGIPLFSYTVPTEEIKESADKGYFFMKIKIGQPGTQDEMLEKDKVILTEIHARIGNTGTP